MLCLLLVPPACAHMVSISTGEIRIEGNRGRYELRMPYYEIQHLQDPESVLPGSIRFFGGGGEARRLEAKCHRQDNENALICEASYQFPAPVDVLEAVSTFHSTTVPNHVHLLRAVKDGNNDQAVLDLTFPRATLRFRPPTTSEIAVQHSAAGAVRAVGGAMQWLFLAALVLAARTRRELFTLAAMFIAGEAVSCIVVPLTNWQPAPRFVEAAAALTIAYLAVEILLLPEAGQRWLVVAVLGAFHGLYFSLFITSGEYSTGWVLLGVALAELAVIAALGWIFSGLARPLESLKPVRAASVLLLVTGLGWFFLRLRS
ncbi:MAG: HupE/UreJ family protein [Bryobacteraceae bacterium]